MNRLKLDWALSTSIERNDFVQNYINQEPFISKPLSSDELETIANYILWGKNENGENLEQEGLVELPRKNSTWASQNIDSLDELTESPTFNETSIYSLTSKLPTKKVREVFPREKTLKEAPAYLTKVYKALWKETDQTELIINLYELNHGKRTKEPRKELLNALTEEEQIECANQAQKLNQFKYLKLRHLLVELRREQYTLRDSYAERIQLHSTHYYEEEEPLVLDVDIPVYPLGVCGAQPIQQLIFQPFNKLIPENFTEEELKQISSFYWSKVSNKKMDSRCIHLTELEPVYQIFQLLEPLQEEIDKKNLIPSTSNLLQTLKFYVEEAALTEIQREILRLKIKKEKNQDIASYINKKYNKSYTTNYISTIFKQKIIPAINEAAKYHEMIIQNLFFKEEFKVCTRCGRSLLRDPINFVRKSRAKDGLSNRCKECDKKDREEKKEVNKNG